MKLFSASRLAVAFSCAVTDHARADGVDPDALARKSDDHVLAKLRTAALRRCRRSNRPSLLRATIERSKMIEPPGPIKG